jgi:predicted RNase H-like nuclease (RuvC/YqgF family)
MLPKLSCFGLVVALSLAAGAPVKAQQAEVREEPVKPSGPAAKKADDLIRGYTARIEKEIDQGHKEVQRLRAELHELIDVRYDMAEAISELRGELASKGTYSADAINFGQAANQANRAAPAQAQGQGMASRRDLFYGLGSALPKDPTPQQREQLRRLAPRSDLKRMIERLRDEVDETRAEVDQLAYKLLELREGIPASFQGFGGGMGGGMAGRMGIPWFGSIGMQGMGGMR